jgi:hypothetical protein
LLKWDSRTILWAIHIWCHGKNRPFKNNPPLSRFFLWNFPQIVWRVTDLYIKKNNPTIWKGFFNYSEHDIWNDLIAGIYFFLSLFMPLERFRCHALSNWKILLLGQEFWNVTKINLFFPEKNNQTQEKLLPSIGVALHKVGWNCTELKI